MNVLVGTAMVDITPEAGVELSGYVARTQPSVSVHDPLYAHALYVSDRKRRVLWLHTDLIGLECSFVKEIREGLGSRFGFSPEEIVLSATHTHAGPAAIHLNCCGEYDPRYMERLRACLIEAAGAAMKHVEKAEVLAAEGICALAMDRRGTPTAHRDHRVGVLAWRRADASYAAVLANYAMHNVALGSDNRLISGDVAGRAARTLRERLPGAPTVLLTNGACGNINPPGHVSDFAQLDAWGDQLATSVIDALRNPTVLGNPRLHTACETIEMPLDVGDAAQIQTWAEQLRAGTQGATGYVPERVRHVADTWEQMMLKRCEDRMLPTHVPMEIHVLRIGRVVLVCLGAEVFSVLADELRAATGETLYVVGYANGDVGYLPTRAAYAEGGYEVDSAFIFYNAFRPKISAFEMVRDAALYLVGKTTKK